MLRGIDLLELVSLEGIADDLSHLGSIEGNSCFHNKLGTIAEVLENARNETGRPPMALILTLEERIECSGGIHTIADHLHGKKVIGGALIVVERSAGRSGLLVVLLIEADLGTDEHKAVLTLPELEQIAAVLIVEIDSDSVIVHYGEASCEIVQRVETELLLPGVEVVNIEELALEIILVRKQSAVIERAQTELSSDSRIDIIELTEKVVLALVGDSLLESRDIIGVLEVVRSASTVTISAMPLLPF